MAAFAEVGIAREQAKSDAGRGLAPSTTTDGIAFREYDIIVGHAD